MVQSPLSLDLDALDQEISFGLCVLFYCIWVLMIVALFVDGIYPLAIREAQPQPCLVCCCTGDDKAKQKHPRKTRTKQKKPTAAKSTTKEQRIIKVEGEIE